MATSLPGESDNAIPPPQEARQHSGGRRERRHRETHDEIVRVARQIVMESGASRLTVREIARRTDFTPSALYLSLIHI